MLQAILGLAVLTALVWALSENRRATNWKTVATGLVLQIVLAMLLLKLPLFKELFLGLNSGRCQERCRIF